MLKPGGVISIVLKCEVFFFSKEPKRFSCCALPCRKPATVCRGQRVTWQLTGAVSDILADSMTEQQQQQQQHLPFFTELVRSPTHAPLAELVVGCGSWYLPPASEGIAPWWQAFRLCLEREGEKKGTQKQISCLGILKIRSIQV